MLNFPKFIVITFSPAKKIYLSAEAAVLHYRAFLFNCPVTEASCAPIYFSFSKLSRQLFPG